MESSNFSVKSACSFQNNLIEVEPQHRKWRRVHGFELPLHPQQVFSWFIMIIMVVVSYLFIATDFESYWLIFVIPTAVIYAFLLVLYCAATIVDPAHPSVRKLKSKSPVPEFDRTKHLHVIENGRCHLCNITVSSKRTKHCGICNKCVDEFDHHCRWLNQCIGKRNYLFFFLTVLISTVTCFILSGSCIYVIFQMWYLSPKQYFYTVLRDSFNNNSSHFYSITPTTTPYPTADITTTMTTSAPPSLMSVSRSFEKEATTTALPSSHSNSSSDQNVLSNNSDADADFQHRVCRTVIYSVVITISIIAAVMLMHLLIFHIYICSKGLTTYEYLKPPPLPGEREGSPSPNPSSRTNDFQGQPNGSVDCNGENGATGKMEQEDNNETNPTTTTSIPSKNRINGSEEDAEAAVWTTTKGIGITTVASDTFSHDFLARNSATATDFSVQIEDGHYPTKPPLHYGENDLVQINNEINLGSTSQMLALENEQSKEIHINERTNTRPSKLPPNNIKKKNEMSTDSYCATFRYCGGCSKTNANRVNPTGNY